MRGLAPTLPGRTTWRTGDKMSKGSKRRPSNVSVEEYAHNYDKIFKGIEPEIPTATQAKCTAIMKYVPPDLTKMDHPTACKYLVEGMKVRLIRRADSEEKEWYNYWIPPMDTYIGKIYTVAFINPRKGVVFREIGTWHFPAFCLQIIKFGSEDEE